MNTSASFLVRDPETITPWVETCGQIRCLVDEKDGAAAEIHQVEIENAKLHYHARTDEFYYIVEGEGQMQLDEEVISLKKGQVIYVPRGVKHRAWGRLKVLTICIPRGVLSDVHEVE